MSAESIQMLAASFISLLFSVMVYRLAKRELISVRYAVGWLFLCALGIFSPIIIFSLGIVAHLLNLSPVAILAITAIIVSTTISIQITISLSGQQKHIRRLAEQIAMLEMKSEQIRKNGDNE